MSRKICKGRAAEIEARFTRFGSLQRSSSKQSSFAGVEGNVPTAPVSVSISRRATLHAGCYAVESQSNGSPAQRSRELSALPNAEGVEQCLIC